MKEIEGGVCAPAGFSAGGIRCGIKASSQKRDLALIYSDRPGKSAAVFTSNQVKAAGVLLTKEHLAAGGIRGVIINSGNANACTGEAGLAAARRMAELAAEKISCSCQPALPEQVAVASTGVIGVPLPIERIEAGMDDLIASCCAAPEGNDAAAEAIMTTDTRKKTAAVEFEIRGKPVRIGAMVKGSGMIHPNMATLLGVFTTDAALRGQALETSFRQAVGRSFNRLSVDGDTSTNDMILVMANGAAENSPIKEGSAEYEIFSAALESLCVKLVRELARDGEGASRLLTVTVNGAATEEDAAALARSVVSSNLVKAAIFGADANWGRVLSALGSAGPALDPAAVSLRFAGPLGEIAVCRGGVALPFDEAEAKRLLLSEEVGILVDIEGGGTGRASAWGCDLSYDYVKINGDYRT
ncbi:MAG: bifunctional glutamate N-acetyltransferase/amino-acid acetyltransferase ArgJ [Spirochaetaceae bacterium]|jgi:glutamate N-acetyltransferase/amino-acid N-acetyltransferase|nr:bifunctional glutamate N-acetyltransferase/amino-acid acetyltransferase ArgJ [Spirochaetaceae bacterium]